MNKIIGVIVIIAIIIIGGYYLLRGNYKTTPPTDATPSAGLPTGAENPTLPVVGSTETAGTTTPTPTPTPTPAPSSETTTAISIQNFAFDPATLTVKAGTTVVWTNDDQAPHRIKSTAFNSENLNTGDTYSFKFETAGTFDYICSLHPSMQGKIIVE
ncbi:MAG TPA: plastocyanin [Candidatus Jacksonbacteria bacterium]|nr:plastocyanin [Candidatus Jacksonbacteria bacterium]HCE49745.1 plastocyanin [Candidatus Jacksonbacteria bacterium]HCR15141.1 plastocyanin [Candidatus Jacksonbacteria bacterium]